MPPQARDLRRGAGELNGASGTRLDDQVPVAAQLTGLHSGEQHLLGVEAQFDQRPGGTGHRMGASGLTPEAP